MRTQFGILSMPGDFIFVQISGNLGNFARRGWYEISVCWFKSSGIVIDVFVKAKEFFGNRKWRAFFP